MKICNFESTFPSTKFPTKKLAENLFRGGSGSGRFQKSDPDLDPDPVKNHPDPQQCSKLIKPNSTKSVSLYFLNIVIIYYALTITKGRKIRKLINQE
jgi:hypothetical protein